MGATMLNPDLRRKIKVRLRPDLIINRQRHAGQTYFIVKDPVSLRYYRFREEELFLLQQFDGEKTFDDVRHEFVEKFRPQRLSVTELEKFVQQLLQAGIATVDTPQLGQRLYERYKQRMWDKVKQFFANILYIKIPIFDPDRLLAGMLPYTRFVYSIPFFALAILFGLTSLLLVLINWHAFVDKLPSYQEFFTLRNVMYFWGTLAVVKVLHEFGHGTSCKHFGGEVHEMGFLFLVLTPCLYCNVTDSWMLPSKWHRAIIGAAGIYVELIISAICVWVWWYTEPGLLHMICLTTIFICSVSTVIFNGNPLLRYDGYYILSDLLEIPNLRERSNRFLGNVASKVFFGEEAVADPYMPKQRRFFFIAYAVAAYIYRWFVTFGILWFLHRLLKPFKLATLSYVLVCLALIPLLILPVYRVGKTLKSRWRQMKVNKVRMVCTVTAGLCLAAAILFVPLPMWITAPLVLQPHNASLVYVQEKGMLKELNVKDADTVMAGFPLGRLADPEMEKELRRLAIEHEQHERSATMYLGLNDTKNQRAEMLRAEATYQQINKIQEQLNRLVLTAPVSGTVFTPPEDTDMGKLFNRGDLFCQIGDPNDLEAYIVVEHSDIVLIKPGSKMWLKLAGHVGDILETDVEKISTTEIDVLPPTLSNKYGGHVQANTDEKQPNIEHPMFRSYSVKAAVPNHDGGLVAGVRGYARIDIGYQSIFWRVKRYFQQTFHFRM